MAPPAAWPATSAKSKEPAFWPAKKYLEKKLKNFHVELNVRAGTVVLYL
jgi:hypothetical protein